MASYLTPEEQASVANAARDVADNFLRFERDMRRLRKLIAQCGADHPQVIAAVQRGCDSPDRRRALETINARMAAITDA